MERPSNWTVPKSRDVNLVSVNDVASVHRWQRSSQVRLSARAAFCLATPLVVGLVTVQRAYGTLIALGALWGVSQDGLDRWRNRSPRMLGVALAGGPGLALGAFFVQHVHSPSSLVVLYGAVAFVAGLIEASLWATQGMYLLLGVVLGGGLGFTGRIWQSALCVIAGGLFVYVTASLTDRRSRRADQRLCLANAMQALAQLMEAIGTPGLNHARSRGVVILDAAQDVVGAKRLPHDDEGVAIHQVFIAVLQIGELASYLTSKEETVDVRVSDALRHVATSIRLHSCRVAVTQLDEFASSFATSLTAPSRDRIAASFRCPEPSTLVSEMPFRSTIHRLPLVDRSRFALLFAGAVVVATIVAHALDGPKGYWLPMTVAFVFRPDLGPVMRRAIARVMGTFAGVAIAAIVAVAGNQQVSLIALCSVMAALVPWAARRSHALTVMVFTPIVFVFIGVLGPDQNLFGPRIVDTVIGASIVLAIDYVMWLHAPSLRPRQQLDQVGEAVSSYRATTSTSDPVTRHSLRRNALRAVTRARSAIKLAGIEPHLFHESGAPYLAQLNSFIAEIDDHTVELFEGPGSPDR
jgi:Fusaric acid resistance protein-like